MLSTPVIYIFFNRPAVMERSLASIRAVRPTRLHLIADGPRDDKPGEADLCAEARALVERSIDWPCEITRDYSIQNLGCGRRLSSGLTAAFDLLGEAIVIEDDIVAESGFYAFCSRMLAEHRHDSRVHSICGFTPLNRYQPARGPAVASLHNSVWGWASWQRSWRDYRFDISEWRDPAVQAQIRAYTGDDLLFSFYRHGFDETIGGQVDSWDHQWSYTMLRQQRHALTTTVNFVENLGFDGNATHTCATPPWLDGLRTVPGRTPAAQHHPIGTPDRRHDRLLNFVTMSGCRMRIAAARLAARSAILTRVLAP
ncbi:MAG: glycosyltransferase [Terrimicrobiaceae bacterium]|nr:glycosyltransferase [Terrimicrobiaceae bacterium]